MKNKYKLVILIFFVIAEIIYLLFSISGVILFRNEPGSEMFNFTIALALHAVWLLCISCGGMIRMKKREKFSLIKNILMLPIATIIALAIGYFVIFDFEDSNIAGIVFLVFGLILTGLMHLHMPVRSPKADTYHLRPAFTHKKSEWNYKTAIEYCMIYNLSMGELSDEDRDKINEYSDNWLLYFIAWLVKHHFFVFNDEITSQTYETEIVSENRTPSQLFVNMDRCLSIHNFAPELHFFMTQYFAYQHSSLGNYWDDYLSAIHIFSSHDYCVEFSWDIYHEIEKLIDRAYKEYRIQCECDDIEDFDMIHCDWLDADITVRTSASVPTEYVRLCAEHFRFLSSEMKRKICESIREHLFTDDISDDDEIIPRSHFDSITVFKPYGSEPAYTIGGEPDYEEEHGVAVMIRGDKVVDAGYRCDVEYSSPWFKEYAEKYNEQED